MKNYLIKFKVAKIKNISTALFFLSFFTCNAEIFNYDQINNSSQEYIVDAIIDFKGIKIGMSSQEIIDILHKINDKKFKVTYKIKENIKNNFNYLDEKSYRKEYDLDYQNSLFKGNSYLTEDPPSHNIFGGDCVSIIYFQEEKCIKLFFVDDQLSYLGLLQPIHEVDKMPTNFIKAVFSKLKINLPYKFKKVYVEKKSRITNYSKKYALDIEAGKWELYTFNIKDINQTVFKIHTKIRLSNDSATSDISLIGKNAVEYSIKLQNILDINSKTQIRDKAKDL